MSSDFKRKFKELSKKIKSADKNQSKILKSLKKPLKSKLISRALSNSSNVTVQIKEVEAPSVLGDTNRFFKGEMEEVKKAMFFS